MLQEGTDMNQAVELYNPTNTYVYLDQFYIGISAASASTIQSQVSMTSGAYIMPGGTYTICTSQINANMQYRCNELNSGLTVTGTNVIMLVNRIGNQVIDTFGAMGTTPGSGGFTVCGNSAATVNRTLVRKSYVFHGQPSWSLQIGTSTSNCDWIITGTNTFGQGHTCGLPGTVHVLEYVLHECES